MAEAMRSIVLRRELATDAADPGRELLLRRASIEDRPTAKRDVIRLRRGWAVYPPAVTENVIRLRGGWVLYRVPGAVNEIAAAVNAEAPIDPIDMTVEADRRIARVPPLLSETSPPDKARKLTWNLEAIGITGNAKQPTGKNAVVAVLDSGIDLRHPDFPQVDGSSTRALVDDDVQDQDGHGTHTAGIIAAHPPAGRPRYSIAPNAELRIIDVHDSGDLRFWTVLQGMALAAEEGAHIISMSLGNVPLADCPQYSPLFDLVGRILLDEYDTIIVAAAGNESVRSQDFIGAIVQPADCPSIIAVAAVNEDLQPTLTSSGGVCTQREPTLAAPGLGILSASLTVDSGPDGPYQEMSGTSAAAPHVAGVAALWVEKGVTGRDLIQRLLTNVKPLNAPNGKRDVGAGLVQAPRS